MRGVLVDAGPLVSLLDRGDPAHDACIAALKVLRGPMITVWPALTEAMYILGRSWLAQKALWSRLETGALTLATLDETDAPRMRELMEKYRDLPMDLADAALVRVAERQALTQIFTLDRTHFSIYRPGPRRRFSIVPTSHRYSPAPSRSLVSRSF
jgi:predicted nucleic acid-binding protein